MSSVLKKRLAALDLSAATVSIEGNELLVALGDAAAEERAMIATRPGGLSFRPVLEVVGMTPPFDGSDSITPVGQDDPTKEVTLSSRGSGRGTDGQELPAPIYRLGPELLNGSAIEDATTGVNAGQWEIRPVFREGDKGIDTFNAAALTCNTGDLLCPTKQLAIVLDGIVLTAPTINESSFARDQIQISGSFTEDEAREVAVALRFGSVPRTELVSVTRR